MACLFMATGGYGPFPLPAGREALNTSLSEAVGGEIEVIPLSDGRRMVVNKDGANLRANMRATNLAGGDLPQGDFIKGNCILCAPGELEAAEAVDCEDADIDPP